MSKAYGLFAEAKDAILTVGVNATGDGIGLPGSYCYGLRATAVDGDHNYGIKSQANGTATNNNGVEGLAYGGTNNYAISGIAFGGSNNYAVYGYTPDTAGNQWAGYFRGKVTITRNLYHGTNFIFSDAALKTDLGEVVDHRDRLNQLRPRSYRYTEEAQSQMGASAGIQLGFIAQEVEEVLPELVSSTRLAAVLDTSGQEIWPAQDLKAVNYVGLIPLLVAGYQQQQSTIATLTQRLDEMQQTLAACCANPDGSRLQAPTNSTEPTLDGRGDDRKLRIVPNPFNESTTVYYTLERGGRTQLMANSADGRELRVLQEADLTAGDYQFEWNTAGMAPGMYYVTLLLDGQPVVKKGVKVAR